MSFYSGHFRQGLVKVDVFFPCLDAISDSFLLYKKGNQKKCPNSRKRKRDFFLTLGLSVATRKNLGNFQKKKGKIFSSKHYNSKLSEMAKIDLCFFITILKAE